MRIRLGDHFRISFRIRALRWFDSLVGSRSCSRGLSTTLPENPSFEWNGIFTQRVKGWGSLTLRLFVNQNQWWTQYILQWLARLALEHLAQALIVRTDLLACATLATHDSHSLKKMMTVFCTLTVSAESCHIAVSVSCYACSFLLFTSQILTAQFTFVTLYSTPFSSPKIERTLVIPAKVKSPRLVFLPTHTTLQVMSPA